MSVLLSDSKEPITEKRQLVEYFAKAGKPKSDWLIGCEHEKFPFRLSTLKPVSYEEPNGMRDFLRAMQSEFKWEPVMEGETIIGLTRGKSAISFEPGAQLELAGAPLKTLTEVAAEDDLHFKEVHQIGEKLGIGFLGIGFHPTAKREDIKWVPKGRYRIMGPYMLKRGTLGQDMMLRTCTVQVNLDFADEADMIKKFRAGLALQPIATSLFASSPFKEGKPNGYNSYRMNVWTDTDPDRSGYLPFVFEDGFSYERYTDYALDVPMYFVYRNGRYIDCSGQSFRDFMQGKLPALPGEVPTLDDWANHLTTLFPDVRLKKIIEMRGADMSCQRILMALPAFWTGLLYDSAALDAAHELVKEWTESERVHLHNDVPRLGLRAKIHGRTVLDVAKDALAISREGLRRRAPGDERYLEPLIEVVGNGRNRADEMLLQFQQPNFDINNLFKDCRL
ncbi:MAG TPA: glutamate--cysteine ligase [Alphaproteobacteria bacterium]|nr:glutamate--cysteine ligase [Alphaproteobacteria bacterium]